MATVSDELNERRRSLAGRRRELKSELTTLQNNISALDTVLLLMDAAYKPEAGRVNQRGKPGRRPIVRAEI